jgi:hypothetical protein
MDTPDPIPHELHQHPVHRAKVTVWCAVSSHGIIGPYCFENAKGLTVTVNAEWYKVMLGTFLHMELHPCQQGNAVVLTRNATVCYDSLFIVTAGVY